MRHNEWNVILMSVNGFMESIHKKSTHKMRNSFWNSNKDGNPWNSFILIFSFRFNRLFNNELCERCKYIITRFSALHDDTHINYFFLRNLANIKWIFTHQMYWSIESKLTYLCTFLFVLNRSIWQIITVLLFYGWRIIKKKNKEENQINK